MKTKYKVLIITAVLLCVIGFLVWWFKFYKTTGFLTEEGVQLLKDFMTAKKHYNRSAKAFFEILQDMELEWWPTEGTLIGMLRYGSNFAYLPSIGYIATDTDIDIMVRVRSDEDWDFIKKKIEDKVTMLKDFSNCTHYYAGNEEGPHDKMVCHTPYFLGGDDIHVDIHRYIVNEVENYAFTNTQTSSLTYPFQIWNNKIPYKGVITDSDGKFRVVKFEDISLPCPYKAEDILNSWNDKEYLKGQLRYPVGGVYKLSNGLYGFTEHEHILTLEDKAYLHRTWCELEKGGFETFHKSRVVISLTTIPPRLPKLKKSLEALQNQNVDAIYLNIPYICNKTNTRYDPLPDYLTSMENISIVRCEDYGPLTKLLPTLAKETDPSTIIIICDDDMIYNDKNWADGLVDAVNSKTVASYETWNDEELHILMGYKGFAFQRQSFGPDYLKYFLNLSQACKFGDDYAISYYLNKKGIRILKIKERKGSIKDLGDYGMPESSLREGVKLTQGNESNYKQCKKNMVTNPPL